MPSEFDAAPIDTQSAPALAYPHPATRRLADLAQVNMRRFGDHTATRQAVFDNAVEAVKGIGPVENSRYRLDISDVGYGRQPQYSTTDHKNAILDGKSLAHRLQGTVTLTDRATGTVADARRMTIAAVPYLTRQGVFVLDGNALAVSSQARLDPGVFTRRKQSGGVEAHVSLLPGNGVPHRLHLDPATGVFRVSVGQAELPVHTLLDVLGATPEEMKAAWGDQLAAANARVAKDHHLNAYYEKFGPPGPAPADADEKKRSIAARMSGYRFDPWITNRTLGKPFEGYNKDTVLAITKKLLAVSNGAEPDDRDDPAYSSVWGPEHLIAERLARSRPVLTKLLWQATNAGSLKSLPPGFLSPSVRALFTKSGLGQIPEGSNASEFVDHGSRITKVGEGGIGRSADSAPMSARQVHIGQIPFIDTARASESESIGLDLRTAFGTQIGTDRRIYAPLMTPKGRIVYRNPRQLADAVVAFPGWKANTDPMVPVVNRGKVGYARREDVNYFVPSMEQTFSPMTNMVPMKAASKPHRSSMGARMITQSLPLMNVEAPLVRSAVPGQPDRSVEELYGRHMGTAYARPEAGGTVTSIGPDHIKVKYDDGKEETHELYDHLPSGRKTGLTSYPLVAPGDRVEPGQLIARSNYTDDKGHAAYGLNARIGFMPYRGAVYEDALTISRSFADKMKSHHLFSHQVFPDDNTGIGRTLHAAAFPGKYKLSTLKSIDEEGVVKPGTTVNYGDPLILAVRKKDQGYARLSRSGRAGVSDASETWEHDEPGKVVGVRKTPNGPVVLVETFKSTKEGDKIAGRHGNKGVVNVVDDAQMPVGADGRPLDAIISSLSTISRVNPSAVFEAALGKIAAKTGKPYVITDFADGQNIGKFVEDELAKHGVKFTEDLHDPVTGRTIPNVGTGNIYLMKLSHISEAKAKGRGIGRYDETGQPVRGQDGGALRASLGDTMALLSYGACFMGSVNVTTENGDMDISTIVNDRLRVRVACADAVGNVVYRPVTDWFCRSAHPDELLRVETTALVSPGEGGKRGGRCPRRAIRCTRNHQFYTARGKVPAEQLVPGDTVYSIGTRLRDWQVQLLIGGLMGDSYGPHSRGATGMGLASKDALRPRSIARGGHAMSHAAAQRPYLLWKATKLANIWPAAKDRSDGTGGFAGSTERFKITFSKHPQCSMLTDEFYATGEKRVPPGIVERMGWYGIGVWFADDGSANIDKEYGLTGFKIAVCSFAADEVARLAEELSAFSGLPWKVTGRERRYYLYLTNGRGGADNLNKWAAAIAPYLPPMMGYKIDNRAPTGAAWADKVAPNGPEAEPVEIVAVSPYRKAAYENYLVYDITVEEHHNYFAGGVQVSNSSVLKDAHMNRGQSNDVFWQAYMAGFPVPHATESKAFHRFVTELKAAGINPVRENNRYRFMGLTAKDVDEMAGNRVVKNGETLDASRDNRPYPGGLMDEKIFGAVDSKNTWAAVPLHEPVLNPVYEEPARRLLGLTEKQFRDTIAGNHKLAGGLTGMDGIVTALKTFDVKAALDRARADSAGKKKTARDAANRQLGYLKYMAENNKTPADWIWDKVPVMPPAYRPVTPARHGSGAVVSDANLMYRELIDANSALRDLSGRVADVGPERLNLYDAVKGVVGLGDAVTAKNRQRGVKGVLARLLGDSSKMSFVQQKLLGTPVDLSGRGQVLPNPDLDLDQLGLPEGIAWDIYHPFVVRRLVRGGVPRIEAAKMATERTEQAKRALLDEMAARPVLATRYPVLHRYGTMGFRPKLVSGDAILSNNLINKPYNLDHDGNCVDFDTELTFDISKIAAYSTPGWFKQLEKAAMRVTKETLVEMLEKDGRATVRMKIGEFPVEGEGVPDKNGALTYGVPEGVKVLTGIPGRGALFADVRLFTVEEDCPSVTVTTDGGQRVVVSDNESLAVFDPETCAVAKTKPSDAVGKWVPVLKRTPIVGTEFNAEIGWLYGSLISDGWRSTSYVGYAKVDAVQREAVVERARRHLTPNFTARSYEGRQGPDKYADSVKLHMFGDLKEVLFDMYAPEAAAAGSDERGALFKKIPEELLARGNRDCLLGLLAGLLEGDGTLTWNNATGTPRAVIRINTSSPYLVDTCKRLMRLLGVRYSVTSVQPRDGANTHTAYVLSPSVIDVYGLITELPFVTEDAKNFAELLATRPQPRDHFDLLPCPPKMFTEVRRVARAMKMNSLYVTLTNGIKGDKITRTAARTALETVDKYFGPDVEPIPLLETYRRIVEDTDLLWERVETVTDAGRRRVYDLGVPDGKLFAVNDGLVVYDTFTVSVPLSDAAVKETYEKLLPSKNLYSPASFKGLNFLPNMEYLAGLYTATAGDDKNPPVEFDSLADAKRAFREGKISYSTRVRIRGQKGDAK